MLKRARDKLPERALKSERFEIPKVTGHLQGNKTVVTNFTAIANTLRREPEHLLKYLQRELATPAQIDGPRLVLGRKLNSVLINSKIEQYAKSFVLCPQCGKPDTEMKREEGFLILKCTACGAKYPIKAKI
ncbi:MAG: translation initiation factor IF-2 subunit beta [Nanoarchaeota archaeon]|nr:translation initiation factor IF-2 subunit beta [Nanoarchaeota archaeon]